YGGAVERGRQGGSGPQARRAGVRRHAEGRRRRGAEGARWCRLGAGDGTSQRGHRQHTRRAQAPRQASHRGGVVRAAHGVGAGPALRQVHRGLAERHGPRLRGHHELQRPHRRASPDREVPARPGRGTVQQGPAEQSPVPRRPHSLSAASRLDIDGGMNMSEQIDHDRRRFLGAAGATLAAASLGAIASGCAPSSTTKRTGVPRAQPGSGASFGPVKQIEAGLLNIAYVDVGPAGGPAVILLHGWPYDIHSYIDVAPLLASAGYRAIVPYLRGYGTTRFLSSDTLRNAQQSAVAMDIIALMDALRVEKAIIAGFDWGARTADVMAVLWPERCKAIVAVSGYLITSLKANLRPLPPAAEYGWWYQYYFATERGRLGYSENRHDFNKLIWKIASPTWNFD